MKRIIAMLLATMLLTSCAANTENLVYKQVSIDEAVQIMADEENYIILDVRTPEEFADKHIPNAINVPNEDIGGEEIAELPDKDQLILVYCRSGNRRNCKNNL